MARWHGDAIWPRGGRSMLLVLALALTVAAGPLAVARAFDAPNGVA
jgi:hypothetical protein